MVPLQGLASYTCVLPQACLCAVGLTHLDFISLGIPPVQLALLQVQGQSIGPPKGGVHQDMPVSPI